MHWSSVAALLLVSHSALALPQPPRALASPPSIGSLGTLQALKYNNLGPENNGTAAVLVYDRLPNDQAKARCGAIGETLLPLSGAPQARRTELSYQLDYLVLAHDLHASESFWVGGLPPRKEGQLKDDPFKSCLAYSQSQRGITPVSCDANLPALCGSILPPTTDLNRIATPSSRISISAGNLTVTGYRDGRSFRFMSVPFANPPVKELRFAPPQPYSGRRTIDATRASASCIQSQSGFGTLFNGGISEDCLYLNVFTPILPNNSSSNTSRPVAVYFYGGAFTSGSATLIDYDGGNFASRNDVVVVTVNYRVGALGFLATGNMTTGSYGTRDQILALEWVQQHIAAFGGDPSHVTIFGQSAGGQSVIALLSSSATKGLYSGAIVQSAPLDLPWFSREIYSEAIVPEIAKAVGCDKKDDQTSEGALLNCLRSVPATSYLDNTNAFQDAANTSSKTIADDYLHVSPFLTSVEPFMPMVDDNGSGVIDDQFNTLLSTGKLPNHVPTMFTIVTDEASFFAALEAPTAKTTQAGLNRFFHKVFPPGLAQSVIKSNAFPLNHSDPDGVHKAGADALTHSEWSCPHSYLLSSAAKSKSKSTAPFPKLYGLEITDGHIQIAVGAPAVCSPNNHYNATCHTADVLPIWGNLNSKIFNVAPYYSVEDIKHSQLLNDVFSAFFHTRNPNPRPEVLKVRGPAYQATLEKIAGEEKYRVPEFRARKEVSVLGVQPGWTVGPGTTEKCRVFQEYGFTFQNANFTL